MSQGIEFVRKWDTTGDAVRFRVRVDGQDHDGRISHTALIFVSGQNPQTIDYGKAFSENLQKILEIVDWVIRRGAINPDGFWISERDVRRRP